MFLMMHPWYIPSTDMAKKLVLKYPSPLFCDSQGHMYVYAIYTHAAHGADELKADPFWDGKGP